MKSRMTMLAAATVLTVLIAAPARVRGQQPAPPQSSTMPAAQPNMMMGMMATDATLDDLVQKMNAATGTARTDAMAALLTALVQERHQIHGMMMTHMSMMSNMMQMMNMKGGMNGMGSTGDAGMTMPKK